jgi:hypothetical protein
MMVSRVYTVRGSGDPGAFLKPHLIVWHDPERRFVREP